MISHVDIKSICSLVKVRGDDWALLGLVIELNCKIVAHSLTIRADHESSQLLTSHGWFSSIWKFIWVYKRGADADEEEVSVVVTHLAEAWNTVVSCKINSTNWALAWILDFDHLNAISIFTWGNSASILVKLCVVCHVLGPLSPWLDTKCVGAPHFKLVSILRGQVNQTNTSAPQIRIE